MTAREEILQSGTDNLEAWFDKRFEEKMAAHEASRISAMRVISHQGHPGYGLSTVHSSLYGRRLGLGVFRSFSPSMVYPSSRAIWTSRSPRWVILQRTDSQGDRGNHFSCR
jgi:hypothetical protein